ncbi:MAG TPA: class I SAM-dependent methyltransferase [Dehalococcoidia bacterium]|nr:class I SAM-dependent methyltransferase [Dehalococcoidia bacterium]
MDAPTKKLPQPLLPRGLVGRFVGWVMPLGHSAIYKRVAPVLNLQPEDDVLDVGCGAGYFLKRYASHVNSIAALDYSEVMVEMATNKHRDRIAAGTAAIVHGEASQLPWEDNRFSAVTSMGSFIVFPKPLESLKEMCRVLRPGGRAVVSIEYNAEDGKDHSKEVKNYGMSALTEGEVRQMMEDAGFSEVSIKYDKGLGMPKMMLACGIKK